METDPPDEDLGRSDEDISRAVWSGYVLEGKTVAELADEFDLTADQVRQTIDEVRASLPDPAGQTIMKTRLEQIDAVIRGLVPRAVVGGKDAVASLNTMLNREAKYLGLDDLIDESGTDGVRYEVDLNG